MTVSKFHELLQYHQPDERFPDAGDVIHRMRRAPKFVFSENVLNFMDRHKVEYDDAIEIAAKAGQTGLPHDPMVVEYDILAYDGDIGSPTGTRCFWLLEQNQSVYRTWHAQVFRRRRSAIVFDGSFHRSIYWRKNSGRSV